jgi:hypothetical protein
MAHLTTQSILIFGGTGVIGKYITSALLQAQPAFETITLFTSKSTATSPDKAPLLSKWQSRGLRIITGDVLSEQDVKEAFRSSKAETVISAVGRNVLEHQADLLRWAEQTESVKWFLPSEYGTDVEYWKKSVHEKPHAKKLALRKVAREEIRRVKVTYVVTGPYFDMWVNPIRGLDTLEAGGIDVAGRKAGVIDEGEGKIGFCTMSE